MKPAKESLSLLIIDFLSSSVAWGLFYCYRKLFIEDTSLHFNEKFYMGILLIPLFWITLYYIQGTYKDVKRIYRMKILNLTFFGVLLGTIILFFAFLLDDSIRFYQHYYTLFSNLFIFQFVFTFFPRFIYISYIVKKIHSGKDGFRTIVIGGSDKAKQLYHEIISLKKGMGNQFVGFVNMNGSDKLLEGDLPYLGHITSLETVMEEQKIEEVIIAVESSEHTKLNEILSKISGKGIRIKILPDTYDILAGNVKMISIFGVVLLELNEESMPFWQATVKRLIDIVASLAALLLLIPAFIVLALIVKFSSKGPVFFSQERVGMHGRPFRIIKFRTMYVDAEAKGPQLSSAHDPRITKSGRFFRKVRLDELPQFYNVLIGDMSLVGPRPERQFFIDQIVQKEPQYLLLNSVRPGITSWGQVKYGYAENVDQMIQRMKFDLLYLKNRSLALDLKIMMHTVLIVLKAKGK